MKIILEGERPVSWNKFYAGMHHSQRKDEADRVHQLMLAALLDLGRPIIQNPVKITITVYFDKRQFDSDNIPPKLYIDGLVLAGTLFDDAPKYVIAVTTQSRIDRENPRVEILIEEVNHAE